MRKMSDIDKKMYTEMIEEQYFIDQYGKEIRWTWGPEEASDWVSLHAGICERLFPHIKSDPTDHALMRLGWIAMGSSVYGIQLYKTPTQAQLNTLDRLGYDHLINDKGEFKIRPITITRKIRKRY